MKSAAVKVRPGDKIRLSKIDPDDTGKLTKEEARARFVARSCAQAGRNQTRFPSLAAI